MIGSVGPNVSSRHARHRVVDVDEHGRLVEAARRRRARLPPTSTRAPLRDGVLHVPLDDVDLRREGDRADVDDARPARARPGAARGPCRSPSRRTRRRRAPRRRRARPRCRSGRRCASSSRTAALAARSTSASAQHDHRVLAAELEPDRRERLGGALARPSCRSRVEPVNMTKSTSSISARAGRAVAGRDLEDVLRQPALAQHLGHQQRRQRRHLAGLEDHGVAGGERRDAVAEGVRQRVVPRADHADDADAAGSARSASCPSRTGWPTCTCSSAR